MGDLRQRGACVLLTTHELAEAERMADRVVIVQEGRSVAEGTPAELAAAAAGTGQVVTFGAPTGLDVGALGEAIGADVVEEAAGRYRVAAAASPALTARLAGWLAEHDATLTDLRAGRTLEETYLAVLAASPSSDAGEPVESTRTAGSGRRSRRRGRKAVR